MKYNIAQQCKVLPKWARRQTVNSHISVSVMIQSRVVTRMHSTRMRTVRCSGCLASRGVFTQGVSTLQGVFTLQGVSAGGCLPRGCLPIGVACPGGICLGVCTPPVNRITDRCKNITFLQLLLATSYSLGYPSMQLSVHPSAYFSMHLCVYPSVNPSAYLSCST